MIKFRDNKKYIKQIYDEVEEYMFDMSNVRILIYMF